MCSETFLDWQKREFHWFGTLKIKVGRICMWPTMQNEFDIRGFDADEGRRMQHEITFEFIHLICITS